MGFDGIVEVFALLDVRTDVHHDHLGGLDNSGIGGFKRNASTHRVSYQDWIADAFSRQNICDPIREFGNGVIFGVMEIR